jgi:hypothetical protein
MDNTDAEKVLYQNPGYWAVGYKSIKLLSRW